MQRLQGSSIVVGVAGSIAAYRACDVVRRLRELGARVRVAPTRAAQQFVTPLTFEALSGETCLNSSLELDDGRIPHVEEAYRARVVVVAPASADLLARMAAGFADEAILSLLLSYAGPVVVAPAMETHMWQHAATRANIATLRARGVVVVGPGEGALASGRSGAGRLAPVDEIIEAVVAAATAHDMAGRRVVVTAGPTVEDLDPVRYLTNRSSGKMGLAVARECALRGAVVELVHGPLRVPVPTLPHLHAHPVRSAAQMEEAVRAIVDDPAGVHAAILAAAVADYTPVSVADRKLKKSDGLLDAIALRPTVDILAGLGARPARPFVLVGFAAETHDVERYAHDKRARKGCDLVVANDVAAPGSGFDVETNRLYLARAPLQHAPGDTPHEGADASAWLPQTTKEEAATHVVDEVVRLIARRDATRGLPATR